MADITQNFSQLLLTYGPGAMLDLPNTRSSSPVFRIGAMPVRTGGRSRRNASSRSCASNSARS